MNKGVSDIIELIELHDVEGIRQCFANGLDPNSLHRNEPLIYELLSEYTRGPGFKDCVKAFVEFDLKFNDRALLATLLNNAVMLQEEIKKNQSILSKTISFRSAYTPLEEVSLLHVCAEFNHAACAEVLINHGADVNATAGTDEYGFGAQTPIFHTVNQNNHQSAGMMQFLLDHGAKLDITVKGIVWGKGYPWETFIPSVNPISYAMMGLLPQMHRNEKIIADVVSILINHLYRIDYISGNIPNKYLST